MGSYWFHPSNQGIMKALFHLSPFKRKKGKFSNPAKYSSLDRHCGYSVSIHTNRRLPHFVISCSYVWLCVNFAVLNQHGLSVEETHVLLFDSDELMDFADEFNIKDKLSNSECNNVSIESENEDCNPHVIGKLLKYIQCVSKTRTMLEMLTDKWH